MKKLLVLSLLSLFSGLTVASEGCSTSPSDNGTDLNVFSSSGDYLGYVSPNSDGSWFIWVDRKGAKNEQPNDQNEAIELVCAEAKD